MSRRCLKFRVKFYCNTVEETCEFKNRLGLFFENCHDSSTYEVDIGPVTKCLNKFICEENTYTVIVALTYLEITKEYELDKYVAEICRKWCIYCHKVKFLYWLTPLKKEDFNIEDSRHDRLVKSTEFAFGTMPDMENFVKHYQYKEKSRASEIMCSFYHSQKYFIVYFEPNHDPSCQCHQHCFIFRITYDSISRVIVNATPELQPTEFFFVLNHPPEVKLRIESGTSSLSTGLSQAGRYEYTPEKYERILDFGCKCKKFYYEVIKLGKSPVFKLFASNKYRARHIVHRMTQRCRPETEFYYSGIKFNALDPFSLKGFRYFPKIKSHKQRQSNLNSSDIFSCQYAWCTVLSYSWVIQDQILIIQSSGNKDIFEVIQNKMRNYALCNTVALCKALFLISEMVATNAIFYFDNTLDELFKLFCDFKECDDLPNGMCFVRRILIMPSRILYLPPTEHFDNRVIRKYGTEYMLRISVLDDNYQPLSFMLQYHSKREGYMEKTVKNILVGGIKIGDRHYEVLASSNSQLRDHGLWMYSKDDLGNSALSIRTWMGNFTEIKNVAKYMARMGQCFSTSEEAIQLAINENNVHYINDVATCDGRYTFSDGIGTISPELANEVRQALRKNSIAEVNISVYEPCAFQIRYKGCKGMLVENCTLVGRVMCIRPSMKKFYCTTSNSLEIVKVSAPRQLFLSRPLITILEQLGISHTVFLKLQKEMILKLVDSLLFPSSAVTRLNQFSSLNIPFSKLEDAGLNFMDDAFFRSLILTSYRTAVEQLKKKTRIAVPCDYGRNMFGVLDETRTLKYGQVFVQFSEHLGFTESNLKVITGTVVVTKNPCMHPGDVRKFEAVDVPCLKHVKDCIVFPAHGKRPHPDEMAGSDLDGDEFVVIWHPDLIFPSSNVPPMVYPVYKEMQSNKRIDVQDMIDFFCKYIMNDNIGTLANAHLIWADHDPNGIFSEVCLSIAKKYPYVLDFAKTGKYQKLIMKEKAPKYPDFMDKMDTKGSYYSTRALGILYRTTRELQESVNKIKSLQVTSQLDPFLCYPGWEEYEDFAKTCKSSYNFQVERILEKFGVKNEADAFLGYFQGIGYNQGRYENSNMSSIVKKYVIHIWKKIRLSFFEESEKEFTEKTCNSEERKVKLYRRASALYMVVYKSDSGTPRIFSMPWTVADILVEVRKESLKIQNQAILKDICFLRNPGSLFEKQFSLTNESFGSNTMGCVCLHLCREILKCWIAKTASDRVECYKEWLDCFTQTFDMFVSSLGSHPHNECVAGTTPVCFPHKIIIDFLKFCFFTQITLVNCNVSRLQNASLQTLSNLAITHDLRHLGIKCEESCNISKQHIEEESNSELEGKELRISVERAENRKFLENNWEAVKNYLREASGVMKILMSTDYDRHYNWFLLINAIGESWHRHKLEDIVLDVNLFEKLEKIIENEK